MFDLILSRLVPSLDFFLGDDFNVVIKHFDERNLGSLQSEGSALRFLQCCPE